jgi:hypothetical protein
MRNRITEKELLNELEETGGETGHQKEIMLEQQHEAE